ncbi:MAG: hypothetical protein IJ379_12155 [Lachnospiraceae bacterium]|nr:hypothetical protein [Lachnospiraceae bacterium]
MNKARKNKLNKGIFLAILLCALTSMIYFGSQKNGYHVDEIYSFGLANSEYLPFMHFGESGYDVKDWMLEYGAGESFGQLFRNLWKDFQILKEYNFDFYCTPIYEAYRVAQANSADTKTTTWVSGQDYQNYVTVSPENTFNYASVYYNQRGDVHPPFFYMLLHTICSIFQGSFSKWYGLVLNMVFLLLTLGMLYKMCREFCGGEKLALAVVASYVFSYGFVTTAMYIRMYAMLTFFVVWSCYLHLELLEADFCMTGKRVRRLVLVTLLGFYTHYYYVLYAIGVAAVCCVIAFVRKHYKSLFRYIFTMAGSAIIGLCIWPFAVKHVFSGYRGRGSLQSLTQVEYYFLKIKLMISQIFNPSLGGKLMWLVVLLVLAGIVLLYTKGKKVKPGRVCVIYIPIVFYSIMVSQIVPFYTDRYVMCVYPFVILAFVSCVYYIVRVLCGEVTLPKLAGLQKRLGKHKEGMLNVTLLLAFGLLFLNNNYIKNMPGYLFPLGQETVEIPAHTDGVYVLPDGHWNETAEESSIMAKCDRVAVVYESNLPILGPDYVYETGDTLMVCIQKNLDTQAVLEKVQTVLKTEHLQVVSEDNSGNFVRIMLSE